MIKNIVRCALMTVSISIYHNIYRTRAQTSMCVCVLYCCYRNTCFFFRKRVAGHLPAAAFLLSLLSCLTCILKHYSLSILIYYNIGTYICYMNHVKTGFSQTSPHPLSNNNINNSNNNKRSRGSKKYVSNSYRSYL